MELARSLLFVPAHRARMVEKALALAALDVAILDLEDGVPPAEKPAARAALAEALARPAAPRPLRLARVNALATGSFFEDLAAAVRPGGGGIVLPKVERPEEVARADALVAERERAAGLAPGSVPLVPSIETARGLLEAAAIATASPRVAGLLFGAEDFAADLGLPARREGDARELLLARSGVVVAAAAARVLSFDGVWPDVRDLDGLRRDAEQGRRLGFSGKTLLHPDQVAVANEVFTPSADEVAHARRVVAGFEEAQGQGKGTTLVDGGLVDRPVVERARRILRAWELSGR